MFDITSSKLLILGIVALLLFGGSGKISSIMGDVAKGIKSFKKGMSDEDEAAANKPVPPKVIEQGVKQPEQQTGVQGTKVG